VFTKNILQLGSFNGTFSSIFKQAPPPASATLPKKVQNFVGKRRTQNLLTRNI